MKKILIASVCLIGFALCGEKKSDFDVKGMMCGGGCVKKINRAIPMIRKNFTGNFHKSFRRKKNKSSRSTKT